MLWAAEGHRHFAGELAAWHLAGIVAHLPLTGRVLDPAQINPYRLAAANAGSAAAEELRRWHRKRQMRAMVDAHRRIKRPKAITGG